MKISITVSRTIQTAPYESSKVEVTQEITTDEESSEDARNDLYRDTTRAVKSFIDNESKKYRKEK